MASFAPSHAHLLSLEWGKNVGFNAHLSDLVSIYNELKSLSPEARSDQIVIDTMKGLFPAIMLYRTRYKQSLRLENGRLLCSDHPLNVIYDECYPVRNDGIRSIDTSGFISMTETVMITEPPPAFLVDLLARFSRDTTNAYLPIKPLPPTLQGRVRSNGKKHLLYPISPTNILTWISVVKEHMSKMSEYLLEADGKVPTSKYAMGEWDVDYAGLDRVLVSLGCLIDGGLFQYLINHSIEQKLEARCKEAYVKASSKAQFCTF
jgi:hypothetical protein